MSSALELASDLGKMAGKPAYIEFSTIAKHMAKQSEEQGRYVAVDVDMVTVRQIGAADSCVHKVEAWLKQNRLEVAGDRLPAEHADYYEKAYKRWKSGQEMPIEGTPIKTWPVISPAQVKLLVELGCRTVEDLSTLNDEGLKRIGMGGVGMKNKAQAWLAQAKDKGPATMEIARLRDENAVLSMNLAKLTEQVEALQEQNKANRAVTTSTHQTVIPADDILGEDEPAQKPGKNKKVA